MKALQGIQFKSRKHETTLNSIKLPVHEFSSERWGEMSMSLMTGFEDPEAYIKDVMNVAIKGIEGDDYEPTADDREQLQRVLSNSDIREYLHRLKQLNEFGLDVMQEAEKKFEAARSTATDSSSV